jgi:hypothetical protein
MKNFSQVNTTEGATLIYSRFSLSLRSLEQGNSNEETFEHAFYSTLDDHTRTIIMFCALGVVTFLLVLSVVYVFILRRQAHLAIVQQREERRESIRLHRKARRRWFEASTKLVKIITSFSI